MPPSPVPGPRLRNAITTEVLHSPPQLLSGVAMPQPRPISKQSNRKRPTHASCTPNASNVIVCKQSPRRGQVLLKPELLYPASIPSYILLNLNACGPTYFSREVTLQTLYTRALCANSRFFRLVSLPLRFSWVIGPWSRAAYIGGRLN